MVWTVLVMPGRVQCRMMRVRQRSRMRGKKTVPPPKLVTSLGTRYLALCRASFCLYRCPRDSMNVVWNSERLGKQWCAGQVEGKAAPSPAVEHFACRCDTSWQAAMAPDAMAGASTVWRVEGRERPGLFMSLPAVGCQSSHYTDGMSWNT